MNIKRISVDQIKGADYNPRKIEEDKIKQLSESITKLGFILPILVNVNNNVIVAGHQRTKTARRMGIKEVPAFFIKNLTISDEINFNQIHNGSECICKVPSILNKDYPKEQYVEIDSKDISVDKKSINMAIVDSLCHMILKYGNVFLTIICKNEVVFQNEYVYACKLINCKCNAYICDDSKYNDVKFYFSQSYGEYNYDHIKKNTYVQGLAQLFRTADKNSKKDRKRSILYEELVYPFLKKHTVKTILDFGCGKGAYINYLKDKGYKTIGVEFYNNNKKSINVAKGNKQIDNLIAFLKEEKTFDIVICDSVLNSTDSLKAEKSIMDCLNLFSKTVVFISGITLKKAKTKNKSTMRKNVKTKLRFFDKDNFTASFRNGQWYYQKYHTKEDVNRIAKESGFKVIDYQEINGSFKAQLEKTQNLPTSRYIEAISFEFNLPLPNNTSYNRHEDVLKTLELI